MINFEKSSENAWLKPFFSQLTKDRPNTDLDQVFHGITIICFNYDRCIEHYLIHVLQQAYSIQAEEAARLVKLLEIYHPYGTVGELKTSLNPSGVAFGATLNTNGYIQAVQNIRTFTEQVEDEDSLTRIKHAITNAETIIFLGFAYHKQNMEILKPISKERAVNAIFGTAYGISVHEAFELKPLVRKMFQTKNSKIKIDLTLKCGQLLQEYQISF